MKIEPTESLRTLMLQNGHPRKEKDYSFVCYLDKVSLYKAQAKRNVLIFFLNPSC